MDFYLGLTIEHIITSELQMIISDSWEPDRVF